MPSSIEHVPAARPTALVSQFRAAWHAGNRLDASAFLRERAGAKLDRSTVLDIAYEEFCLRTELGEVIEPDAFVAHFPAVRGSLTRLLSVHQYLALDPQLTAGSVPKSWPQVGDEFLGFELVEELGRGAFARVFLAAEVSLSRRPVVIKLAVSGAAEAEIIAKMQHPHVIPIHSVRTDTETGLTLICMPYNGRATLCDVVDATDGQGLLCEPEALQRSIISGRRAAGLQEPDDVPDHSSLASVLITMAKIAEALEFAHAQGICHQDLKPSNVVLSFMGEPLLLDFNLSTDGRPFERLGGTLPYMAPEQIETMLNWGTAAAAACDPRSDLFAWGVLTVELLTGALPFKLIPPNAPDLWNELLSTRRKSPEINLRVDVVPELVILLRSCLAFAISDRPSSAQLVADAIRRIAANFDATHDTAVSAKAKRWHLSRGRKVLLIFGTLGAAAAFAGYDLLQPSQVEREYRIAASAYGNHRDQVAIEHLNRALDKDASFANAIILRGRCHQRLGKYVAALTDYESAHLLTKDARLLAGAGFCMSRDGSDAAAVSYYQQALRAGFATPEVYNNLGLSFMRLGRRDEALSSLSDAIELDSRLQAAFLNRAYLLLNDARESGVVSPLALHDVNHAIKLGPVSGELFFIGATAHAIAARSNESFRATALEYLSRALVNGYGHEQLKDNPFFDAVRDDHRFEQFLRQQPRDGGAKLAQRALDPMPVNFP